ncbi:oligosaccharide flippase family protein [Rhodobacterales bacterium LSUCC0246]|nr:oligosaccharide flippase family protein [Rhodobacterales bacterium LSUCC0374]
MSIIYSFPSLFSRGIALFLLPIYGLFLTPDHFGLLDLILACLSMSYIIVSIEISQALGRFLSTEKNESERTLIASSTLLFVMCSQAVASSIFVAIYLCFDDYFNHRGIGNELIFIIIFYFNAFGYYEFFQNLFKWLHLPKRYAVANVIFTIISGLFSVIFLKVFNLSVFGILSGLSIGAVVATLYSLMRVKSFFSFQFSTVLLKSMLLYSWPLAVGGLGIWLNTFIDRFFINHFLSLSEVGVYGIAIRISGVLSLGLVGVRTALTPLIYANLEVDSTPIKVARIFKIFTIAMVIAFLALSFSAKYLVGLFFINVYHDAAALVPILSFSVIISGMYVFFPGISIAKKTKILATINLIGLVLNLIFNFIFIKHLGIVGVALATSIASFFVFVLHASISNTMYHVPVKFFPIFCVWFLAISTVVMGVYLPNYYKFDPILIFVPSSLLLLVVCFGKFFDEFEGIR